MITKLTIDGMSCDHCVKAATAALCSVTGVETAKVNLKTKSAEVDHHSAVTLDALKAAVEEAGFEAAAIP